MASTKTPGQGAPAEKGGLGVLLERAERRYRPLIRVDPQLSRNVVSYQANKDAPFYRWFRYQEGFSTKLVDRLIEESGIDTGTVLDPFAGIATTLFSARERGLDAVGFELLPIGPFVARAWLAAEQIQPASFDEAVREINATDFSTSPAEDETAFKHVRISEMAFPPGVERKISAFRHHVENRIGDKGLRDVLHLAGLSILEKVSYTEKCGQFLRWDSQSGKARVVYSKTRIRPFEEALAAQLDVMSEDINAGQARPATERRGSVDLRQGTAFELFSAVPDGSIDLVISSPPYLNRYDYTRVYPLELAYLGVDDAGLKRLRQSLLSCTVENREKVAYLEDLYAGQGRASFFSRVKAVHDGHEIVAAIHDHFEKLKDANRLNNPNVYRLIKNYFFEHAFVIFELARVLKAGGRAYYVNDNVRFAGIVIPVDIILSDIAIAAGLQTESISTLPVGKGNSSQQMGAYGKAEVRKCIYTWRK
ncbi:MAG: site-specific DNA-methyltransferase [Candidatus Lokiarchaeota archaeon]|nr:site-specific DNA-methyltransferase [Candidatus Lokiarchaeota archaeon]